MELYEFKVHLRHLDRHQIRELLRLIADSFDPRQIASLEVRVAEPRDC